MGLHSWKGSVQFAGVQSLLPSDPLSAFVYNNAAYQEFPYPVAIRRQLSGAASQALMQYAGKINLDPGTADWIWQVGITTSPWDASVLMSRVQYLLYSGRFEEVPEPLQKLVKVAPRNRRTFIALALFMEATGNREQAVEAAQLGLQIPETDPGDTVLLNASIERNTKP